ncbi:hypothetical protein, partial [Paenibacillus sp. 598K]|uniref:hypothetical protein n=1 Tax=Paenibacillus sp. 598K TaxID=1117987 RepID=UPI001623D66C
MKRVSERKWAAGWLAIVLVVVMTGQQLLSLTVPSLLATRTAVSAAEPESGADAVDEARPMGSSSATARSRIAPTGGDAANMTQVQGESPPPGADP